MNSVRRLLMIVTAFVGALLIVGSQLAWNLRSPDYMRSVAKETGVNKLIATKLPEYAATKLPNPEDTKVLFAQKVTPEVVAATLDPLYVSMSDAYLGKTDLVAFSLEPLITPIEATGYEVPPGTVFANEDVQAGGLASILRTAQRIMLPALIVLIGLLLLLTISSIRQNPVRTLRNVVLLTSLMLVGFFVATLLLPFLVDVLVSSSSIDTSIRQILLKATQALFRDAGKYYLVWAVVLLLVAVIISLTSSFTHRAKKPPKHRAKGVS